MDDIRLKYLGTVARYQSISRASDALYITPSALSKFIKKLEHDEGIKLFDRVGKKFMLTYAGERYIYWLQQIENLYSQMNEELNDISHSHSGRLKVGVQTDGSNILIDSVLPEFYKKYPDVLLELYEETSGDLRELLEDNSIDFAIIPDSNLANSIKTIHLNVNHRAIVVPKGDDALDMAIKVPGAKYKWIDINKIKDRPFISPFPEQDAYKVYNDIRQEGIDLNIVAHIPNLASQLRCVIDHLGYTISDDRIVQSARYQDKLELLSIGSVDKTGNQVIAYNSSHYITDTGKFFIELTKSAYAKY